MKLKTIGKRGAGLLLSALLALSLCLPVSAAGGAGYTDLRGHWAESQLQWAVEQGYLTGTSATTLSPNKTLTRGMAAVILYRYAGSPTAGGEQPVFRCPGGGLLRQGRGLGGPGRADVRPGKRAVCAPPT